MTAERFFITCPRGLEPALADEVSPLGAEPLERLAGGVACRGSFDLAYRVNLYSRLAGRVLWRVADGAARDETELYKTVLSLPWAEWFSPRHTIKVTVTGRPSGLRSLEFATLRIKDAVCDRFRDMSKRRPSVDTRTPNVRIVAHVDGDRIALYLDTSGEPLFKRGWRAAAGEAPLRENLAAGLLRLAGWTPGTVLVDPMCGGGTILMEAAQMTRGVPPGLGRSFGFECLRRFDSARWQELCSDARRHISESVQGLYGCDRDPRAIDAARINLGAIGLSDAVSLAQRDALTLEPPAPAGLIVTNPPYGVRTGTADELAAFYPRLGDAWKQRFAGWTIYLLTADARVPKMIGLTPSRRMPLFNGPLECRLYEFRIVAGSFRGRAVRTSRAASSQ